MTVLGISSLAGLLGFTELPWILSRPLMVQENIQASPVILALYCGYGDISENGLCKASLARVQKAVHLWKEGNASFILFSGGSADKRGNGLSGAQRMALEAGKQGVPKEKIITEEHSKDTRYKVLNSIRILREKGYDTLILVTNDFHMKRTMSLFEGTGFQVYSAPVEWHPRGKWKANLEYLHLLVRELQAWAAYRFLSEKQIDTLIDFLRPEDPNSDAD